MFYYLFEKANRTYERVFYNYGKFIARHYIKVIVVSFTVNLLLSLGIFRLNLITDVDDLFFPIKSQAKQDEKLIKNLYNNATMLTDDFYLHQILDFGTWAEINFQTCSNDNILSELYLQRIEKIHNLVLELDNIDRVCAKRNGNCLIDGADLLVPDFYETYLRSSMEWKSWDSDKIFRFYTNINNDGDIRFTDLTYNLGIDFRINDYDSSRNGTEPGYAKLVKLRYNLKDHFENAGDDVKNWEHKFINLIKNLTVNNSDCNDKDGFFKISYGTSHSLDNEMAANMGLDTNLISGTFMLICIFATFVMSIGTNCLTSPSFVLPTAGILSAVFAILSSFGLCSLLNYQGCTLIFVIPFLIFGIGIDDMFLIYSSFQYEMRKKSNLDKKKSFEKIISKTLARSGISITITSLTDFTAFMVGVTTEFRGVQIFCVYAAISILFCYFYQITFFTGFLCLHYRRILSGRNAHIPCIKIASKSSEAKFINLKPIKKFLLKNFKFLICSIKGKIITLVLFIFYISFSIWNAVHIKEGIKLQDLISEDSYYSTYIEDNSKLSDLRPIIMLIIDRPIDYDYEPNRILIQNLVINATNIQNINKEFKMNWLENFNSKKIDYKTSINNLVNNLQLFPPYLNDVLIRKLQFNPQLNKTIDTGFAKLSDLKSNENINEYQIVSSRFYLQLSKLHFSSLDAKTMHELRMLCQKSGLPVFPYSISFKYTEQFEKTPPNIIKSFTIAIVSMLIISILFIPDLISVFCIIASMISIMTGLVGFMHLWDLTLSSITMIELVMSIGFCVDFSAHVVYAFLTCDKGDRNIRAYKAFKHVGIPIFNSAFSTMFGIILLAFCKSYIFKSFFKTLTILMALGMFNSLLFLPVILSVIGPQWPMHKNDKNSREIENKTELLNLNENNNI